MGLGFSRIEFEVVSVDTQGHITQRKPRHAEYWWENLGQGVNLDLVLIPGGTSIMGSAKSEAGRYSNEGPQHQVTISRFWMGKYPVTQAQWRVVAAMPQVNRELAPAPSMFKSDNRPVESVSWDDAVEFCQRLSKQTGREYRLPAKRNGNVRVGLGQPPPFTLERR